MLDINGKLIRVGDHLRVGGKWAVGIVVCSIDTDEFTAGYAKEAWGYLERGVLVDTDKAGLIHYDRNDEELEIIEPAQAVPRPVPPLP